LASFLKTSQKRLNRKHDKQNPVPMPIKTQNAGPKFGDGQDEKRHAQFDGSDIFPIQIFDARVRPSEDRHNKNLLRIICIYYTTLFGDNQEDELLFSNFQPLHPVE